MLKMLNSISPINLKYSYEGKYMTLFIPFKNKITSYIFSNNKLEKNTDFNMTDEILNFHYLSNDNTVLILEKQNKILSLYTDKAEKLKEL